MSKCAVSYYGRGGVKTRCGVGRGPGNGHREAAEVLGAEGGGGRHLPFLPGHRISP